MRKIIITKKLILETAKKYKSVTEWDSRSKTTCRAARVMFGDAFYRKAISHMIYKKIPKTKILKIAKKYNSVKDFIKHDNHIYNNMRRWGKKFHKKATAHMTLPYIKWTKEAIIKDAKKYKRKMEWAKNSPSAYSASYTMGINKIASNHFEKVGSYVSRCIYSISVKNKKIIYIGLTYDYQRRMNNHLKSKRITDLIKIHGKENIILKKLTKYLPTEYAQRLEGKYINYFKNKNYKLLNVVKHGGVGSGPSKWTNQKIILEAQKYDSIGEWYRKDKTTLGIAYKRRLIDKCKKHMKSLLRPAFWWKSKEAVLLDAKKYKKVKDWRIKSNQAYLSAKNSGFLDEATIHMSKYSFRKKKKKIKGKTKVNHIKIIKWTKENIINESKKYKSRTEWQKKSGGSYSYALRHNLLDKLLPRIEYKYKGKWTKENIIKEAKKYDSIVEWQKNSWTSYKRSRKLGINNIIKPKHKRIKWNKDLLHKDAKKYSSRSEWNIKSPTAYRYALENGYLKKIFPKTFGYGNRNYD